VDDAGAGRSAAIGSIVGIVVFLFGTAAVMLAVGLTWQAALGLGLFLAFWGGLGFGAMCGGVLYLLKHEATSAPVSNPATSQVTDTPIPTSPDPLVFDGQRTRTESSQKVS